MPCTAPHIANGPALCAGCRRRENGVAALAPRHSPGGSFLWGLLGYSARCDCGLPTMAQRPPPTADSSAPSQPLRHLFEEFALVARETLDAVLRDLVEHAIELLGPRFPPPR